MDTTNCDFTISIKSARVNRDLSRKQLALMLNVSPATVKNWELGITKPDSDKFVLIANITKTPLDFLRT